VSIILNIKNKNKYLIKKHKMDKLSLDEIQKIQDALVAQVNREYEQ